MWTAQSRSLLRRRCSSFQYVGTRGSQGSQNLVSPACGQQRHVTSDTFNHDDNLYNFDAMYGASSTPGTPGRSAQDKLEKRLWMGPELTLTQKVAVFLEVPPGELARLDVHLLANDLIRESCKLRSLSGLQQAHDILSRILLEKRTKKHMMISAIPFDSLMHGWAVLAKPEAHGRMIELLRLMEKEYEYDQTHFESSTSGRNIPSASSCAPTTSLYNTVLRGLARIANVDVQAAVTADNLFEEMIHNCSTGKWATQPNTKTYTLLISVHGNTCLPQAVDRAEFLLSKAIDVHEQERTRYELKFGHPYDTKNPSRNIYQIVTPDQWMYAAVMNAIIKSNARNSADRASALLDEQLQAGIMVSAHEFNVVITGLAKQANAFSNRKQRFDAAARAEALALSFLEQFSEFTTFDPHEGAREESLTFAFNSALNGWANAEVSESAARAEALFKYMLESPSLRPEVFSLNTTLNALGKHSHPMRAERLLQLVNSSVEKGGIMKDCIPNTISYSTVMSAWANSEIVDKTQQTRRLLSEMMSKYEAKDWNMKPNIITFTTILGAAASIHQRSLDGSRIVEEAYEIALDIYEVVMTDSFGLGIEPDSLFFKSMFNVISVHTDITSTERRQRVQRVFDDACVAGQVSIAVVRSLKSACPDSDLLARLLRDPALVNFVPSIDLLPIEWTKRVPNHPKFRLLDSGTTKSRMYGA